MAKKQNKGHSKAAKLRRSSKFRIILLVALLAILGVMYFMMEKFRIWIIIMAVTIVVALGFEIKGNDIDLGKLWETKSFKEAIISKTSNGQWIFSDECEKGNFNCDSFSSQEEAQELYDKCRNGGTDDPHRLDGDNDTIVCEALPSREAFGQ